MSVFRDMAHDGGYRGDEAAQVARHLEEQERERHEAVAADRAEPEEVCRRCGGPNVSWAAPSPLWNAVMRGGSIDGPWEFGELICPTCFCVLAVERGVAVGFTVDAPDVLVELELVTPSGPTWDPSARLWIDADTGEPSPADAPSKSPPEMTRWEREQIAAMEADASRREERT